MDVAGGHFVKNKVPAKFLPSYQNSIIGIH